MTHIVPETLQRITSIATLPAIAVRIMQVADDPHATSDDLDELLSSDPALASRVLKVVNSAFYGRAGRVAATATAIQMLGVTAIRNIAVAASLTRMFSSVRGLPNFDAPALWLHSVAVGAAARHLAERTGLVPPEEAMLAGLLHDLGILVEVQVWLPEFTAVLSATAADPTLEFTDAESSIIGASHEEIGEALCRQWHFPEPLAMAVGHHHQPFVLPAAERVLPTIVHVADILAVRAEVGFLRTVVSREIAPEAFGVLGLVPDDLVAIEGSLVQALTQAMVLFSG
jgi:HD-like signal output (HDOD) protein